MDTMENYTARRSIQHDISLICNRCGCVVENIPQHDEWHDQLLKQRVIEFKRDNIPPQHWRD